MASEREDGGLTGLVIAVTVLAVIALITALVKAVSGAASAVGSLAHGIASAAGAVAGAVIDPGGLWASLGVSYSWPTWDSDGRLNAQGADYTGGLGAAYDAWLSFPVVTTWALASGRSPPAIARDFCTAMHRYRFGLPDDTGAPKTWLSKLAAAAWPAGSADDQRVFEQVNDMRNGVEELATFKAGGSVHYKGAPIPDISALIGEIWANVPS